MNTSQPPTVDIYSLVGKYVIELEQLYELQLARSADIYALNLMQSLLTGYPYLPLTRSSLSPSNLAHILNDIIINNRRSIVEFGTGISTIMMGRLIKSNGVDTTITSIEHNQEWAAIMRRSALKEKLEDVINIVFAPLTPCDFAIDGNLWYDRRILDAVTASKLYDLVLVDGPPAYEDSKNMARFPALLYIHEKLMAKSVVYLDDANRGGERRIIEKWEKEYHIKFHVTEGSLAYSAIGDTFDAILF